MFKIPQAGDIIKLSDNREGFIDRIHYNYIYGHRHNLGVYTNSCFGGRHLLAFIKNTKLKDSTYKGLKKVWIHV